MTDLQIKIEGTDANFTLATQTGVSKKMQSHQTLNLK